MNKTQIQIEVCTVWQRAMAMFGSKIYHKVVPNIEFFEMGKIAGKANHQSHTVKFSTELAKRAGDEFVDVIIHEIAHLITRAVYPNAKQDHGPEFRFVAQRLGGTGETKHSIPVVGLRIKQVKRHVYTCKECGKEYKTSTTTHNKIQANPSRFHCYCGQSNTLAKTNEIILK